MLEIDIKPNILDRKRKFVINPEFISYEDSDWKDIPDTLLKKDEVTGFKFGIEPIKGYAFTIGRRYCIDIKGANNRIMKIRFTSLYKIKNLELRTNYLSILDAFFKTHYDNILNSYINLFNQHSYVEILETTFKSDSVLLIGHNVPYEDLGFRDYTSYYSLFSKSNPKIYKTYSYLNDWNSSIVFDLSKRLLAAAGF